METLIRKRITGLQMVKLFEALNIRYYQALYCDKFNQRHRNIFEIKIRHSEDENASQLFEKSYLKLFKRKYQD